MVEGRVVFRVSTQRSSKHCGTDVSLDNFLNAFGGGNCTSGGGATIPLKMPFIQTPCRVVALVCLSVFRPLGEPRLEEPQVACRDTAEVVAQVRGYRTCDNLQLELGMTGPPVTSPGPLSETQRSEPCLMCDGCLAKSCQACKPPMDRCSTQRSLGFVHMSLLSVLR